MGQIDFEGKLALAEQLLNQNQVEASIRENGQLLEGALRTILLKLQVADIPMAELSAIGESVSKQGKGQKTLHHFGFGQLVGVYREAGIGKILKREFQSNFKRTRSIDWNLAVEWRNAVVHQKHGNGMGQATGDEPDIDDALDMSRWTKAFIYDCELMKRKGMSVDAPKAEPKSGNVATCEGCDCQVQEEWKFCPSCGVPTRLECHSCKNKVMEKWKVCYFCEEPLVKAESSDAYRVRWEYATICKGAWMDGVVNVEERAFLNKIQLELGIPASEAHDIEERVAPKELIEYQHYVEGFLVDGEITAAERDYLDRLGDRLSIEPRRRAAIEASMLAAEQNSVAAD